MPREITSMDTAQSKFAEQDYFCDHNLATVVYFAQKPRRPLFLEGEARAGKTEIAKTLASNRTREVHDALKRRCLYHWVDYPNFGRELEFLRARVPEALDALSCTVTGSIQKLPEEELFKKPGVAETIDWAKCLMALDAVDVSPQVIPDTLGTVLKYQDDIAKVSGSEAARILEESKASAEIAC